MAISNDDRPVVRECVSPVSGHLLLARWLRVSALRAPARICHDETTTLAVRCLPVSSVSDVRDDFAHENPLTLWFWAAYLMTTDKRGISALLLQRQLGLRRYETAWNGAQQVPASAIMGMGVGYWDLE